MDVNDTELVTGLLARDGTLPARTRSHWSTGECRYVDKVGDRPCPWCAAEERRRDREAAKSER